MAFDPVTAGFQFGASRVSAYFAKRKASKAKKESAAVPKERISKTGDPQPVAVAYGLASVPGTFVGKRGPSQTYFATGIRRFIPQFSSSMGWRSFRGWYSDRGSYFNRGSNYDAGLTSSDDVASNSPEWLMCQYTFAHGESEEVYWLSVDGAPHDTYNLNYGQRVEFNVRDEDRDTTWATANGFDADRRGDHVAVATGAFRLSRPPQYKNVPTLTAHGAWERIKGITSTGRTATKAFRNNRVEVLLEYILQQDIGALFDVAGIDWPSWNTAKNNAAKFVDTLPGGAGLTFRRKGSVWRRPGAEKNRGGWRDNGRYEVPEWWLDFTTARGGRVKFAQRSGGGHSLIPTAGKARFQGGGTEWEFSWSDVRADRPGNPPPSEHHSIGLSAIRDEDGASMTSADHSGWGHGSVGSCYPAMNSSPTAPNYSRLRLYEYNGMPDGESVMDNIDLFMGGFGEAVLYRKGNMLAISLPVVTTQAEQDLYCSRVFDEAGMLEPVGVSSGSGHDTRTTIVFDDAALNGEPNRVSYPEPGSAEEDALRASNGGKPHESTVHVAGCNNKTYATYLARTYNRQSRRSAGFELTAPLTFRDVECGSGGTVLIRGLSIPVIVDDVEVDDEGAEVRIIARHFSYLDTAWDVDEAVVESSHGGGLAIPSLPVPDSATATLFRLGRLVDVAWTFPSAVAIKDGFIDIQIRKDGGTWEGLTTLAWGAFTHGDKLDNSAGVYDYRVRYRIDPWNAGAWAETNSVRVTEQRAVEQVDSPPPPSDFCIPYSDNGNVNVPGGWNMQDHNVFVNQSAEGLQWRFKRFTAAEIAAGNLTPPPSVSIPADWTSDPNDVPDATIAERGSAYRALVWFRQNGSHTFFDRDGLDPRPLPDLPAGTVWVPRVVFRNSDEVVAVPIGGMDDGNSFTPPARWKIAYAAPANHEISYAAAILYPLTAGETWVQVQGKGSWSKQTLGGSWYSFVYRADIARLGRFDSSGADRMVDFERIVDADGTAKMTLVIAQDRWVQYPVLSALPFGPDADPKGWWLNLGNPIAMNDAGGDEDIPLGDYPVQFCFEAAESTVAKDYQKDRTLAQALPKIFRSPEFETGVEGISPPTNLAVANRDADSLDLTSSTGTGARLPSATDALAGLESAADKTKLDGLPEPISGETVTNAAAVVGKSIREANMPSGILPDSWQIDSGGTTRLTLRFRSDGELRLGVSGVSDDIRREVLDRLKITVSQAAESYETVGVFDYGDPQWRWTPANSAEAKAFYEHLDGSLTAEITLQVVGIAELVETANAFAAGGATSWEYY